MNAQQPLASYKWNARICSGFRLMFDAGMPSRPYEVQEWDHRTMVAWWPCDSLEAALSVLGRAFQVDMGKELERLQDSAPRQWRQAA